MSDNFDRLLVRAVRRDSHVRGTCPDAAVLAAYLDGTLAPAERGTVEAHAADCSRCALQLATLVRLEDATGESRRVPAAPLWRRFLWTVPVATAALAAIVYVAAPSRTPVPPPGREVRSAPAAQAPMSSSETPPNGAATSSRQVLADEASIESRAPAPGQTRQATLPPRSAGRSLKKEAFAAAEPQLGASADQAAAPPAASSPALPQATEMAARSDADAPGERKAEADARAKAAGALAPAAPARIGRVVAPDEPPIAAVGEHVTMAAALVVHAPDARVRWRVIQSRIERSADGGLTWSAEPSPNAADLTMGAAPSGDACWLASPAGRVLRRADTGAWTDVSPAPVVAIAEITVSNAASAVIVSSDGTRLRTRDAGRTWIREERR